MQLSLEYNRVEIWKSSEGVLFIETILRLKFGFELELFTKPCL